MKEKSCISIPGFLIIMNMHTTLNWILLNSKKHITKISSVVNSKNWLLHFLKMRKVIMFLCLRIFIDKNTPFGVVFNIG